MNGMARMVPFTVACVLSLTASAAATFVHPYILDAYERSTTSDGSFRADVQFEDLQVWGFTDAGEVL